MFIYDRYDHHNDNTITSRGDNRIYDHGNYDLLAGFLESSSNLIKTKTKRIILIVKSLALRHISVSSKYNVCAKNIYRIKFSNT